MYSSLKPWLKRPVSVAKCIAVTPKGTKQYDSPVMLQSYYVRQNVAVTNNAGQEVVSKERYYFDGSETINPTDLLLDGATSHEVVSVEEFYNGQGIRETTVAYI